MRRLLLTCLLLIFAGHYALAQTAQWNARGHVGFVFRISNKEAGRLLTKAPSDSALYRMLHTLVDTFDVVRGWRRKPDRGHFIVARIVENELRGEYVGILPYEVYLLNEYDVLSLQVVDRLGNVRTDARVKVKNQGITADPDTRTFRMRADSFWGDERFVTVELDGFRSFFEVSKHDPPYWAPSYYHNERPPFYSYLITDKNRYKPGEKVRFKSYSLTGSRSPLNKELEIWLYGAKTIRLGTVKPHRPGSYAGEFVLHDSLKLLLDKQYSISLRTSKSRVVSQTSFRYEDYQLNGDKLDASLLRPVHFFSEKNQLTIRATDVNGLPVTGSSAKVTVRPVMLMETFQPLLYISDTLLYIERQLSSSGEALIDIDPNIFQRSSMQYRVDVTLTNSEQKQLTHSLNAVFNYRSLMLHSRLQGDSVVYELHSNGISVAGVAAQIAHDDEPPRPVILPYGEKINSTVRMVNLKTADVSRQIDMGTHTPVVEITGGILRDSFSVALRNPHKIETSWYVYSGSTLIDKGTGTTMRHRSMIDDRSRSYYVEVLYTFAGTERRKHREFPFNDKQLLVDLSIPDRVYPGQNIDASILVTNQAGQPVSGVDVTALGVTSKLNYNLVDLPDYGTSSARRDAPTHFSKTSLKTKSIVLPLRYHAWAKRAGLDTMRYYQLLYPGKGGFSYSHPIEDSTQFAIYVVQEGQARQPYVVELNRKPVYYSWTTAPTRYTHYVESRRKNEVTLRLWDRVIIIDTVRFKANHKTVMSFDLRQLPPGVRTQMLSQRARAKRHSLPYGAFTAVERERHLKYIARFEGLSSPAYLVSPYQFVPLNTTDGANNISAGPILPEHHTLVQGTTRLQYQFKGGGNYHFDPNVVYYESNPRLLPDKLRNQLWTPSSTVNDLAWTEAEFLRAPDRRPAPWITRQINAVDYGTELKISLPEDKGQIGIQAVLFEDPTDGSITSACSDTRNGDVIYLLPKNNKHVIVLYNDGRYFRVENVQFRRKQRIWIDLRQSEWRKSDSSSAEWKIRAIGNCLYATTPRVMSIHERNPTRFKSDGNVQGTVYDDQGLPMPGVNVVIKGTRYGTVTDVEGNFFLEVYEGYSTVVFSFIGCKTTELTASPGMSMAVQLETDVQQLQEVVITGYGVQLRGASALAYSVSSALAGRVAGVQIVSGDESTLSLEEEPEASDAEHQLYEELLNLNQLRSNFNDVAFWEPRLYTDRKGRANFQILFPEDITRWNATVYAMNRRLQTGVARKSIKSYKPIMAQLDVPGFMVKGDTALVHGNLSNHSQDTDIEGAIRWIAPGTVMDSAVRFDKHRHHALPLVAQGTDSLEAIYTFTRNDGYADGEKRKLPVEDQGIIRANGTMSLFQNGDVVTFQANDGEERIVEVVGSPLDLWAGEARYLMNYRYACNEQLASKLMGFLAYRNVMAYEEKEFRYDQDVKRIIQRLLKNQNEEFLWSWWDVNPGTSYWVSSHVLRALKAAKDAGYRVDLDVSNVASKVSYRFDMLKSISYNDVGVLQALALWDAPVDYASYLTAMDSLVKNEERRLAQLSELYRYSMLHTKLLLLEAKQLSGMPYDRQELLRYQREGIRGEVFFFDRHGSRNWYSDELAINAVAYRIAQRDSTMEHLLPGMQMYFLSQRCKGQWNTYQSANLLTAVLPDILSMGATKKQPFRIRAEGKFTGIIQELPFQIKLAAGEQLTLRKEGGLPMYLMQYVYERVTEASQASSALEITTHLENGRPLEMGKPVAMQVRVKIGKDAAAEYVMIEVPIPASCSYTDKGSSWNETHREYFKDRVNIYHEKMNAGEYVFEIGLLPRFPGKFHVNPAQISLMYAPVINANTGIKKISVQSTEVPK